MKDINELYRQKGELQTAIEIGQAKLQQVNQQIVELLNLRPVPPPLEKEEQPKDETSL